MVSISKAKEEDASVLTNISIITFDDDSKRFFNKERGGPPGYDSIDEQARRIKHHIYYKICDNDNIIGGIVLTKLEESHMELTQIFLSPHYQNHGIGQDIMRMLEEMYPNINKWSLDTPSVCVRNHHFYEKIGYKKANEIMLDSNTNLKLYFYEKHIEKDD